jgi:hypothetical protein
VKTEADLSLADCRAPALDHLATEPLDMSVEIDALQTLKHNGKTRAELARKILSDNQARFYEIQ